MTLNLGDRRRRLVRGLALAGVAAAGYVFGITSDRAVAQPVPGTLPPAMQPVPPGGAVRSGALPQPQAQADRRVVAYVYGNTPIYREELGDYLIARGGAEKLELLVNKRIMEIEAARRNITVTAVEVQAALDDVLRGLGISKADFEKHLLPQRGKTLFEYVEDFIKPELILGKMCRDQVKVTDEEVRKLFENRYGERREAKIICWSRDDLKVAQKQWNEARKSDEDFDRIAKMQADPNLAAACGRIKPLGRYPEAEDDIVVKTLYSMKLGEISGILDVPAGLMCVKYTAAVPAESGKAFDAAMKESLHKELFSKRLNQEIGKCFQEMKAKASPNLILRGTPSEAAFREGVENIVNQAGGEGLVKPAGGVPPTRQPAPASPMAPKP